MPQRPVIQQEQVPTVRTKIEINNEIAKLERQENLLLMTLKALQNKLELPKYKENIEMKNKIKLKIYKNALKLTFVQRISEVFQLLSELTESKIILQDQQMWKESLKKKLNFILNLKNDFDKFIIANDLNKAQKIIENLVYNYRAWQPFYDIGDKSSKVSTVNF